MSLAKLVYDLIQTNQVFYLQPSFGYFFEYFYAVPRGLVYQLKEYPADQILVPALGTAEISENQRFWSGLADQNAQLRRLASGKLSEPENVSKIYSRGLNYWGVQLQRNNLPQEARTCFQRAQELSAENVAAAVREYQLAVTASPYDYRYWMELGRALEASGDSENAEKALRHAVELAPAYAYPRWHYGNLLLRQDRIDEAFAQLTAAATANPLLQPPVFTLANQVYGDDVEKVVKVLPSADLRVQFAMNLVRNNKFDAARRVMRTIDAADRKSESEVVSEMMKELVTRKQFHAALEILRQLEPAGSQSPVAEQVWNGGFETTMPAEVTPFHWLIDSRPLAQAAIDNHGHSGNRSLRIIFKAPNKLDKIDVSQTITVEPDTNYRIQFYQRTEKLISAAAPFVTITDEVNGGPLTVSPPAPPGTNDWQLVTLEFKTKPKSDGISIAITHGTCSDPKEICPVFGTVWYDDFNLQRIGSPGPPR